MIGRSITVIILCTIISYPSQSQESILLNAHAHNDYKHKRPLHDALASGFFSIEADVFFANGSFIVAHTAAGVRQKNTFERLYLQPIEKRVTENNGRVYSNGPLEFELMIDLKGNWNAQQLAKLSKLIESYEDVFTVFRDGVKTSRAVKIVLSGNGTKYSAATINPRFFSIDGGFGDFNSALDSTVICRTSASFKNSFSWRGHGKMKEQEKEALHEFVKQAHTSGRKIRFWAATNRKKVWRELLDAGVDWVSVDKLKKYKNFYSDYYR